MEGRKALWRQNTLLCPRKKQDTNEKNFLEGLFKLSLSGHNKFY